jgi:hypothetical protein
MTAGNVTMALGVALSVQLGGEIIVANCHPMAHRRLVKPAYCLAIQYTGATVGAKPVFCPSNIGLDTIMFTLSVLLQDNGLPDQPILLVEAHRNNAGIWRIKFSYDDFEPLSMDAEQATTLAISLHLIDEDELASEINTAVARARHYETM